MCSEHASDRRLNTASPPPRLAQRILDAMRRIEADPGAPWRLTKLASDAEISVFHFLRSFRRITGLTPYAYVRQVRLREAARLLCDSDLSITQAAAEAGFGDLSTFHKAFKATFGVPPRQFRNRRSAALRQT
jgi:AraC-like DNA-binding protein